MGYLATSTEYSLVLYDEVVMKFKEVAQSFAEIEQTSSRNTITQLLADLLKKASSQEANIICNISLGELYPPYHESLFNIAQKTMIPIVATVLGESESSIKKEIKKVGDIGRIVEKGGWRKESDDFSVVQVYKELVAIEKISGTGSQEKKSDALELLLRSVDPVSAKYIVRIVLGKLRLGFSDMTVVDALSWMETGDKSLKKIIENAYNVCVDMGLIASTLKKNGIKAVENMSIMIGIPIRPAAAERLPTAAAIFKKIGKCIAQPKLDGFRLQIHIDHGKSRPRILFFSRNLKDMSAMFPELIKPLERLKVKTMICEGEAIGYDANTNSFLPFQETVKRKRKHGIDKAAQDFPLKLFLFDLLYLNDKSLLDLSHEERYEKLKKIVPEKEDSPLAFIQERYIESAKELKEYFKEVVSEGLEGLVVKRPDAVYQPGKRNFNWIKLKRSAEGELEDTIDTVILGYYAGSGRRADFGIGAVLVGVYNKKEDQFETVAKVGTGLSDKQWVELRKKCDEFNVAKKPNNVVCAKGLYPDVWVAPEIVIEVFADEITKSPTHSAGRDAQDDGFGLRFPRFMGYREDKSPEDATTVSELKKMFAHQGK